MLDGACEEDEQVNEVDCEVNSVIRPSLKKWPLIATVELSKES